MNKQDKLGTHSMDYNFSIRIRIHLDSEYRWLINGFDINKMMKFDSSEKYKNPKLFDDFNKNLYNSTLFSKHENDSTTW